MNSVDQYSILNRRYEMYYAPKVEKALKSKVSSLIETIRVSGIVHGKRSLEKDLTNPELARVVDELYRNVGLRHARINERRLRNESQKSTPVDIETKRFGYPERWIRFIQEFLGKFLLEKITYEVNRTTRDALLEILNQAIDKGWSEDETVKHLEDSPFTKNQAAKIVRTEINRAANVGISAQGETFEYELTKEWVSVKDKRTRGNPIDGAKDHADHWDMNGMKIDFDEKFIDPKNGHELRFPGDPEAAAEDTIFCRCRIVTRGKRDEAGKLIPKKTKVPVLAGAI